MHVLLVEDEPKLSEFIREGLQAEQILTDLAAEGEQELALTATRRYDLIILDLMLPKMDGFEVLRRLRQKQVKTPVLVLTARASVEDRVTGLEVGADDYLVKPFAFEELLARIRALVRRASTQGNILRVGDLEMDRLQRKVMRAGVVIALTTREYSLLECLLENAGQPVTRAMLLERVWDSRSDKLTNLVDVYVNYLRAKLDRDFEAKLIRTVRGVGYMLAEPDGQT